ncbi:MAG: DUF2272 domain-containing protein [Rhodospirillales bacterium]|nr:DUF2272 domain-containing protein [Rhodospirillales bacterium]
MRLRAALLAAALAGCADPAAHVPPFARMPYEPFSRAAVVAIALGEWRAFGAPIEDAEPAAPPPVKPERLEGLWQRVGLYWWLGLDAGQRETRWTGMHDAEGRVFPPQDDDRFAWSAAFVSYVMRLAGAGPRFPYATAHHVYINRARERSLGRARTDWLVTAEPPDAYAPQPGDLICYSRSPRPLRFDDLPAGRFPAHCDIVVAAAPGLLDVVGGNVDDAVTLKHVRVTPDGRLADPRYPWFVVLRVLPP